MNKKEGASCITTHLLSVFLDYGIKQTVHAVFTHFINTFSPAPIVVANR